MFIPAVGLRLIAAALAGGVACAPRANEPPKVAPKPAPPPVVVDAPWRIEAAAEEETRESARVLIRGARVFVGDGTVIPDGHVALEDGKITAVGRGAGEAAGATIVDAKGKFVTPGLVDTHSHLGVYPYPRAAAHADGNEATAPVTAEVRAVDSFWPNDPNIQRAVAGGTTTIQALPGSANLVGGRAVTLKLRRAGAARDMLLVGAKDGLKMACGENPKRVYGGRQRAPSTRMGNLAAQRKAFLAAKRLIEEWDRWIEEERERLTQHSREVAEIEAKREGRRQRAVWCKERRSRSQRRRCDEWQTEWANDELEDPELADDKPPPKRNLRLETLAAAIEGHVLVHVHCYRSDDMASALALADEMSFEIRSFHHALEAYKIRDELARRKIGVSTWADWWGFKLEAYDAIEQNIALVEAAGGIPIVHSDSPEGIRRLNQEASKALHSGLHSGIEIAPERWIRWVTANPAWALGVDDRIGTLEVGKDADVVVWSGDPLSVYTRAELVYLEGVRVHDAAKPGEPWSDFEVSE